MHKSCAACGAACERTTAKFTIIYACVKRVSNITKREGATLRAVRCGAYIISKLLAVERLVRCNDGGGALQSAESINCFQPRGGVQCSAVP